MPTQRFREAAPATAERDGRAPAAHRGRRLGSGARRDLRWALRQHPGEHVREVCMHGVKITFFTQQAGRAKDSAIAHGQRDTPEPSSQSPEHDTPPLNSRRRRSRRRAQAYYANKATEPRRHDRRDADRRGRRQRTQHEWSSTGDSYASWRLRLWRGLAAPRDGGLHFRRGRHGASERHCSAARGCGHKRWRPQP